MMIASDGSWAKSAHLQMRLLASANKLGQPTADVPNVEQNATELSRDNISISFATSPVHSYGLEYAVTSVGADDSKPRRESEAAKNRRSGRKDQTTVFKPISIAQMLSPTRSHVSQHVKPLFANRQKLPKSPSSRPIKVACEGHVSCKSDAISPATFRSSGFQSNQEDSDVYSEPPCHDASKSSIGLKIQAYSMGCCESKHLKVFDQQLRLSVVPEDDDNQVPKSTPLLNLKLERCEESGAERPATATQKLCLESLESVAQEPTLDVRKYKKQASKVSQPSDGQKERKSSKTRSLRVTQALGLYDSNHALSIVENPNSSGCVNRNYLFQQIQLQNALYLQQKKASYSAQCSDGKQVSRRSFDNTLNCSLHEQMPKQSARATSINSHRMSGSECTAQVHAGAMIMKVQKQQPLFRCRDPTAERKHDFEDASRSRSSNDEQLGNFKLKKTSVICQKTLKDAQSFKEPIFLLQNNAKSKFKEANPHSGNPTTNKLPLSPGNPQLHQFRGMQRKLKSSIKSAKSNSTSLSSKTGHASQSSTFQTCQQQSVTTSKTGLSGWLRSMTGPVSMQSLSLKNFVEGYSNSFNLNPTATSQPSENRVSQSKGPSQVVLLGGVAKKKKKSTKGKAVACPPDASMLSISQLCGSQVFENCIGSVEGNNKRGSSTTLNLNSGTYDDKTQNALNISDFNNDNSKGSMTKSSKTLRAESIGQIEDSQTNRMPFCDAANSVNNHLELTSQNKLVSAKSNQQDDGDARISILCTAHNFTVDDENRFRGHFMAGAQGDLAPLTTEDETNELRQTVSHDQHHIKGTLPVRAKDTLQEAYEAPSTSAGIARSVPSFNNFSVSNVSSMNLQWVQSNDDTCHWRIIPSSNQSRSATSVGGDSDQPELILNERKTHTTMICGEDGAAPQKNLAETILHGTAEQSAESLFKLRLPPAFGETSMSKRSQDAFQLQATAQDSSSLLSHAEGKQNWQESGQGQQKNEPPPVLADSLNQPKYEPVRLTRKEGRRKKRQREVQRLNSAYSKTSTLSSQPQVVKLNLNSSKRKLNVKSKVQALNGRKDKQNQKLPEEFQQPRESLVSFAASGAAIENCQGGIMQQLLDQAEGETLQQTLESSQSAEQKLKTIVTTYFCEEAGELEQELLEDNNLPQTLEYHSSTDKTANFIRKSNEPNSLAFTFYSTNTFGNETFKFEKKEILQRSPRASLFPSATIVEDQEALQVSSTKGKTMKRRVTETVDAKRQSHNGKVKPQLDSFQKRMSTSGRNSTIILKKDSQCGSLQSPYVSTKTNAKRDSTLPQKAPVSKKARPLSNGSLSNPATSKGKPMREPAPKGTGANAVYFGGNSDDTCAIKFNGNFMQMNKSRSMLAQGRVNSSQNQKLFQTHTGMVPLTPQKLEDTHRSNNVQRSKLKSIDRHSYNENVSQSRKSPCTHSQKSGGALSQSKPPRMYVLKSTKKLTQFQEFAITPSLKENGGVAISAFISPLKLKKLEKRHGVSLVSKEGKEDEEEARKVSEKHQALLQDNEKMDAYMKGLCEKYF